MLTVSIRAMRRYLPMHRVMDLLALTACLVAWSIAWKQTRDLVWPCENDLFRDMGAAQSMLDGQGGADPAYLVERWWYNPLVPALVGALSRGLGTPLHVAYATLGAHLNLLSPFAFYAMMAVLVSRGAALASLIGFLFLGPHEHVSWLHATYSPWLWPCNFSQGIFYLSVLLLVFALRTRAAVGIAAGLSVGMTFLAHTAPAVLLGGASIVVIVAQLRFWRHSPKATRRALAVGVTTAVVAAATASPFLTDVLVHLRRGVRNPAPMQWVAGELRLDYWPQLVAWHLSVRGWLALFGLVLLVVRARSYCRYSRWMLFGWGLATTLGMAYGFASQLITLPTFLPSWHFYFYLHALESALFGVGIAGLGAALVRAVRRAIRPSLSSARRLEFVVQWASVAVLVGLVGSRYKQYRRRPDLVDNRRDAIGFAQARTVDLYEWTLRHTKPTDVFLSDFEAGFYAIGASGRKIVAIGALFSNPYIDVAARARDAAAMLDEIKNAQWSEFSSAAARYQVRYVALPGADRETVEQRDATALRRVFSATDADRGYDVYEVNGTEIPRPEY